MNINEVTQLTLTTEDVSIIKEGIADEIHRLTTVSITEPFKVFKKAKISNFSTKLYAWAWDTMQFLRKTADYSPDKQYIKTLTKIINNPDEVAAQIFDTVISRSTKPASGQAGHDGVAVPAVFNPPDDLETRLAQLQGGMFGE